MAELLIQHLSVTFPDTSEAVLAIPALSIRSGERVAVMGPSGSGKTTLVNAITGMDHSGTGCVQWEKQDIWQMNEAERDRWRAQHIGLVMQDFHLFPGLSAIENVLLPAQFHHWRIPTALRQRAADLLAQVGLDTAKRPIEVLSRGEKQRVAVARALLSKPDIIIADEPTASLDAHSGEQIADLLVTLARESRATLIAITHDARLASQMSRCIQLEKGRLVADTLYQEDRA
ncbi:ABC transporter ATP-binding protein [Pectobacterium brasiliense]|uniref:ABC transporter ATP-binding protein n=1 Tax=Pectobacterium brasiliense TaxID=180957 RepID=A0A3S0Y6G5_9GAMM|nr:MULTISPECIES: ABC transporter ATP-binding protein [Pectobacterium]GKW30023.1 ABC transporter [Pectobacterium carotovorum subsp. carotovorum]MBN3048450.1 ABC transporter ATP-binding protein [Pectobacterium brasiliense]MBN3066088.1 ABC transporter ATP-binding protein [Pectobacterium aquaticum]MBN3077467.1 ABC transporter ATP-binding protein [Pectobacterium brasiliense]MBN3087066.1 ABC transporter ATP-binding protein [Pectobacterium brasiliense]